MEYPRYKGRPPPRQRRVPPSQQFAKKWYQGGPVLQGYPGKLQGVPLSLPQGLQSPHPGHGQLSLRGPPIRQRPVNYNPVKTVPNTHSNHIMQPPNGLSHQPPNGMSHQPPQRPVTPPVRNYWKNPPNTVQFKPEVIFTAAAQRAPPEKQFISAPNIQSQDFDYHIQTNQIPTAQINPIKQIGEKGPIHTIPAPNLSLKDKPIIVDEVRNDITFQYPNHINNHAGSQVTIQKSHEYQVTEPPEHNQKLYRAQLEHQKQIQFQIQKQIQQLQQQNAQQEFQNQQQQHEIQNQQQQILLASDPIPIQQSLEPNTQGDIILSNNLSPKDLYQLVNANYPQIQLQRATSNSNVQLFQPDSTYLEQFPQETSQVDSEKISFQPEYQSFNYDEQAHQKSLAKKDMSSLVSATYNLGSDKEISARNSEDSLAQAEAVQSYFEYRSDVADNKIEGDVKPSSKQDSVVAKFIETPYYSTLPNKEAAEKLAQLQTAGKVNSNLMKLSPTKENSVEPLTIVISDEYETEEDASRANNKEDVKDDSRDYDEYSQEEIMASSEEGQAEFGHRIRPKKKPE